MAENRAIATVLHGIWITGYGSGTTHTGTNYFFEVWPQIKSVASHPSLNHVATAASCRYWFFFFTATASSSSSPLLLLVLLLLLLLCNMGLMIFFFFLYNGYNDSYMFDEFGI